MGKLIVDEFMTLDGVVQAPGAPDEDRSGDFAHGGWQAPFHDEAAGQVIVEIIERIDALLLGRRTYEIFAAYWPTAPAENPIARRFNAIPKYVASRTLRRVDWAKSSLLGTDLRQDIARIKSRHAETHVIGSADLVQTLLRERLVDRFNLWVYPLALGTGKRLFAGGTVPTAMALTSSRSFPTGVVQMTLEPRGEPTYGRMDDPEG